MNLQPGFNEIVMMDRADLSALFFFRPEREPRRRDFFICRARSRERGWLSECVFRIFPAARESRGAERGICGQNGKVEGRFSPVFGRFRSAFNMFS
ncbi:MAG: hypothetical protein IKF59_13470, partial [Lachnospiraceae bacterium]|nr:hypothetical protein [Lachnospiraceae bacterium]